MEYGIASGLGLQKNETEIIELVKMVGDLTNRLAQITGPLKGVADRVFGSRPESVSGNEASHPPIGELALVRVEIEALRHAIAFLGDEASRFNRL